MIIWITGLSGAGKTTIAKALVERLKHTTPAVIHLDGDDIRHCIQDPNTGHDRDSRLANALRICRFAKLFEQQNFLVVVSTMSLFHEIHDWNRANFDAYREIFVKVHIDTLKQRNARGLYSSVASGEVQNVVGIDLIIEEPQEPDLILNNNHPQEHFDELVEQILAIIPSEIVQGFTPSDLSNVL